MLPGKICRIVFSRVVKEALSDGETADGSCAWPFCFIATRSSLIVLITRALTDSTVSPGRMRKFTMALAEEGSTLSFSPDWKIVGAVVVRMVAFPELLFS